MEISKLKITQSSYLQNGKIKIFWTNFDIESLKEVFDYYSENKSKKVAHNIRKQIVVFPESGEVEFNLQKLNQNHRYLVSGNYKIIYRICEDQIIISNVFHTRQYPKKMNDDYRTIK